MKRKDCNTQSPSPAERLPSLDRSSRVLSYSLMPPSDEISSKWHLRGVNWAFHYFNYVDLWFTFADGENKAIWMSFVRLCFPHGYWIHLYSFPDVSICSKTEATEIDNTNNLFSKLQRIMFWPIHIFLFAPHLYIIACTVLVKSVFVNHSVKQS